MSSHATIQRFQGATRMVVTDLDGTLLSAERKIHPHDLDTLTRLKNANILRVFATGRNLFSLRRALEIAELADYVVFSSGGGIVAGHTGEVIRSHDLPEDHVAALIALCQELAVDFMVHRPIPDNHYFHYLHGNGDHADFDRRLAIYAPFTTPLAEICWKGDASQLVIVTPSNDPEALVARLSAHFPELSVIRATSPLDGQSTWIEIFPPGVSKSSGAAWLSAELGIPSSHVLAVGNDYNDEDLLEWAGTSFVMADAPDALTRRFSVVPSCREAGFTQAVNFWLKQGG